jgi:hypothetical protein
MTETIVVSLVNCVSRLNLVNESKQYSALFILKFCAFYFYSKAGMIHSHVKMVTVRCGMHFISYFVVESCKTH